MWRERVQCKRQCTMARSSLLTIAIPETLRCESQRSRGAKLPALRCCFHRRSYDPVLVPPGGSRASNSPLFTTVTLDEDLISVTCRALGMWCHCRRRGGVLPTECKIPSGTKAPLILPDARLPWRVQEPFPHAYVHYLHVLDNKYLAHLAWDISRQNKQTTDLSTTVFATTNASGDDCFTAERSLRLPAIKASHPVMACPEALRRTSHGRPRQAYMQCRLRDHVSTFAPIH